MISSLRAKALRPDSKVGQYEKFIVRENWKDQCKAIAHPYEYSPLPSARHIRLLILNPGSSTTPIAFSLTAYDFSDCPPYEALSYTWGDSTITVLTKCDGKELLIGANLYSALHRLRSEDSPRVLWIDGICINQNDLGERNSQVRLMRDIYSGASSVAVWLGNEATDSAKGFELIRRLAALANAAETIETPPRAIVAEDLEDLGLPPAMSLDWQAVDALYWRAWFWRVWIVQEITLAKSATVFCGPHFISWTTMAEAAKYMQASLIFSVLGISPYKMTRLNRSAYSYQTGTEYTLHRLLLESRLSLATDPRDHVYALLGLASDAASLAVQIDYKKSVADVFTSAATQILQGEDRLWLFCTITDSKWAVTPKLPSWVPDWAALPRASSLLQNHIKAPGFAATGKSVPRLEFPSNGRLHALGRIADVVQSLAVGLYMYRERARNPNDTVPKWYTAYMGSAFSANIAWVLHAWGRLADTLSSYPTGEDVNTAYYTTLNANQQLPGENFPSMDELYKLFHLYYVSWVTTLSRRSIIDKVEGVDRSAVTVYADTVFSATSGRRFCITKEGYMGLVPTSTKIGDSIVLLSGGLTPYVVRRRRNGTWDFLGECYIHGLMNGEVWDDEARLEELIFV